DSWAHRDGGQATEKAKALVRAAVRRVSHHEPLEVREVPVNPDVLVVGGGIAGIEAALTLAEAGKRVYLVEREPSLGGHMAQLDKTFPTLDCSACILTPKMSEVAAHPNIELLTYSEVESVEGYVGNFKVKIKKKARKVTPDCTGCSDCEDPCPITLPSEFDEGLGERKAIYRPFPQAVPNIYTISRKGDPACQASCPIHQNAYGYIALAAKGKYEEALDLILWDNPLPSTLSRVCHHPCEEDCRRGEVDQPLAIRAMKRFITEAVGDWSLPGPGPEEEREERVAVVGSGPAGLACAYDLRRKGYRVKVYEAAAEAGGRLALIPPFRLPREVLERELARLEEIGIEIVRRAPVGMNGGPPLDRLQREYRAVFIAVGAPEERLGLPGEGLQVQGVLSGREFLKKFALDPAELDLGRRVVVIGDDDRAVDIARAAVRLEAVEEATLVCPLPRLKAASEELEAAQEEGVRLLTSITPLRILEDEDRKVEGLECRGAGSSSSFVLECTTVILSLGLGRSPEGGMLERFGLRRTPDHAIAVDPITLATEIEGVFAGGECAFPSLSIVEAMASGRKGAESIHRYLNGLEMYEGREREGAYASTIEVETSGREVHPRLRREPPRLPRAERGLEEEVQLPLEEGAAREEAKRCLKCADCCDCRLCWTVCEPEAIDYSMEDELVEVEVGAVILATGYKPFDPRKIPQYGYGRYDNVITALQFERMLNSSGPTEGKILLKDGSPPKKIAIIHCVGSRDERFNPYCSKICCMYSLKFAHLVRERTEAEVYNFYIDLRAFGKGYEEFYRRIRSEGIKLIRGLPGEIVQQDGKLHLLGEDSLLDEMYDIEVDMVILATGLEPREDAEEVRRLFNISCSRDGWF
ncbi:TPA: FAD-dependent oxidoreductase, partial [Candidatus Bipolaricaulota bacterium]|nr:FAD-dependent oxidoreductase [Candidatus Bipolaricaulota bacterium]